MPDPAAAMPDPAADVPLAYGAGAAYEAPAEDWVEEWQAAVGRAMGQLRQEARARRPAN